MLMTDITKGSDNVFEDLGFEPHEAQQLKTRADLMIRLREFIRSQHWTSAQAAAYFDQPQSLISDLMNGEIDRFTVDRLVLLNTIASINIPTSAHT
jgi:predicted XRE-type DNA-binding protein